LLSVQDLRVEFPRRGDSPLTPLRGVSFDLGEGEVFGLVGETGCGKTLTGLSILRVLPVGAKVQGRILLDGRNTLELSSSELAALRGRRISMIYQDPTSAFNPCFTVGSQIGDVVRQHLPLNSGSRRDRVVETLDAVGLPDAARVARAYPHELSGGMLQRAMIAMSIICEPALLIADEPTTSLDVTIAASIVKLLRQLQAQRDFSILFITHNLGLVAEMCDRVAVLYAGRVVETAPAATLLRSPQHPYTQGLLGALPTSNTRGRSLVSIPGTVPVNPGDVAGCAFASRCAFVMERCRTDPPGFYEVIDDHHVECFLADPRR
jgi:peptide/nickel transport system ATP-binding protein